MDYWCLRRCGGRSFGLSFGSGADPSGGTQYVYAYQILNNVVPSWWPTPDPVIYLSVGLKPDEYLQVANLGFVPSPEGGGRIPPPEAAVTSNSVKWIATCRPLHTIPLATS